MWAEFLTPETFSEGAQRPQKTGPRKGQLSIQSSSGLAQPSRVAKNPASAAGQEPQLRARAERPTLRSWPPC